MLEASRTLRNAWRRIVFDHVFRDETFDTRKIASIEYVADGYQSCFVVLRHFASGDDEAWTFSARPRPACVRWLLK